MTLLPEFTENTETAAILYFNAEGQNAAALQDALEKTYPCFSSMRAVKKDGKAYVALEIETGDEV